MADRQDWEVGGRRRPRWPVVLAAALLAPALVLFARGGVTWDGAAGIPVDTAPPGRQPATPRTVQAPDHEPSTAGTERPPEHAGGAWVPLGDAPVAVPGEHHAVWTGDELVVLGGGAEAAAYRPAGRRWLRLPDAPLEGSGVLPPVWTGESVLVWGERDTGPPGRLAVASYDPDGQLWTAGAASPLPVPHGGVAVWTGTQALVWGTLPGGAKVAAAYDPGEDRWTSLPQAPVPPATGVGGAWTGHELVVWGERVGFGGAPFAAAYAPAARSWRRLPAPPLALPSSAAATWTRRHLVLWGSPPRDRHSLGRASGDGHSAGRDAVPTGAALDAAAADAAWHELSPAPPGSDRGSTQVGAAAAWTGDHVALLGTLSGPSGWLYEPVAGTWRVLPRGGGHRLRPAVAWTGDALLVWGGYTPTGPAVDLVAWLPGGTGGVEPRDTRR